MYGGRMNVTVVAGEHSKTMHEVWLRDLIAACVYAEFHPDHPPPADFDPDVLKQKSSSAARSVVDALGLMLTAHLDS